MTKCFAALSFDKKITFIAPKRSNQSSSPYFTFPGAPLRHHLVKTSCCPGMFSVGLVVRTVRTVSPAFLRSLKRTVVNTKEGMPTHLVRYSGGYILNFMKGLCHTIRTPCNRSIFLSFRRSLLLYGTSRRERTPSSARLSPGSELRCPPRACGMRIQTACGSCWLPRCLLR